MAADGRHGDVRRGPVRGMAQLGFDYGPVFRGVRTAWHVDDAVYAEVALPDGTGGEGFALHPALFDASLHGAFAEKGPDGGATVLPFSWSKVSAGRPGLSGSGCGSRQRVTRPCGWTWCPSRASRC
ncbi:polyketide synthase dehydratase domain-containing protein [Streptomyces sp. M19]